MKNPNPFSIVSSEINDAYIDTHTADEIIGSFSSQKSCIYLYRITGLPKSGKTTTYNNVINTFKKKKNWCVCSITDSNNSIDYLLTEISEHLLINHDNEMTYAGQHSAEVIFENLIEAAERKNIKILIGIDDIIKTTELVKLISVYECLILKGKKIYLLYSGTDKNIKELVCEQSISFFARSDSVETELLDSDMISNMYQKYLFVDKEESKKMAEIVNGYAFAYRVLGNLYLNKKENDTLENLLPELDEILAKYVYNRIWDSLTKAEKELVGIIVNNSNKISEIKEQMKNPNNFDVLKTCLLRKHLIDIKTKGYVNIALPQFKKFINIKQIQ